MQLVCNKKFEIWSLIGSTLVHFSLNEFELITGLNCNYVEKLKDTKVEVTDEMQEFWEQMGVNQELGVSTEDLIEACNDCGSWSRKDRLRIGYLSIYSSFIEARKPSSATRVSLARLVMDLDAFENYPWGRVVLKNLIRSVKEKDITKSSYTIKGFVQILQVWIYFSLLEFAARFAEPIPNDPTPPLLAYKGSRGRKFMKENMLRQTCINNYAVKDFEQMFSVWEDDDHDEEDVKTGNIVRAMFGHFGTLPWKWERNHWPPTGVTKSNNVKSEVVVDLKRRSESLGDEERSLEDCFQKMMTELSSCESQIKQLNTKLVAIEQNLEAVTGGLKKDVTDGEEFKSAENPEDPKPCDEIPTDINLDIRSNFKSMQDDQNNVPSESVNDGKDASVEPSTVMVDKDKCDIDFEAFQQEKADKSKKAAHCTSKE
ncbi:uncharacterized protein LOC112084186 [Eutrema salsugineum]|uniref:uncharacterized protein LOC112084186 n=1 Tax=Eutrema salsugineum TaxID=72664 RepID=UPI000CED1ADA|nr:uncharacterized protein LOC112084186 [Eutrema salsugineum]